MPYACTLGALRYTFRDLKDLLAKASPPRSGDVLAGLAASTAAERMAARMALADLPLRCFLNEAVIPHEADEVTRLIVDSHDALAFAPVASLTVGELREWLLQTRTDAAALRALAPGLTPEMVAAVSKLMRNQDLVSVARKCRVVTAFRDTLGLPGRLSVRLQPNHPVDDARGIAAAMLDGLMYGVGDAVIGINPASDSGPTLTRLWHMLDEVIARFGIPTQSCVLTHVTQQIRAIEAGAPVDLVFQSIAGTQAANAAFGIDLALLAEARAAALSLNRGTVGQQVMYFETGQGSALSSNSHGGVDQQTCEARAYAVARAFDPLLVNTVVGFIGPEYLYDGKQIIRAGLEDHFCGKLLGLPMGCDICYTNHAEADQDDMDNLLVLLGAAGVNFIMGVPGADDIMLNYQSTSFHDQLFVREVMGLRRAPEFEAWLTRMGLADDQGRMLPAAVHAQLLNGIVGGGAMNDLVPEDPWAALRQLTPARIALGRAGAGLPTRELLQFGLDHAMARDAVHTPFDSATLAGGLQAMGLRTITVHSQAAQREVYLQRPDLGRRLDAPGTAQLAAIAASDPRPDVALVIGDGLSALAVQRHALALVRALLPGLSAWRCAPVVLAHQCRVALGDDVGERLGARLVLVLLGERPGLSSPDSLGAYLTWAPRVGRTDAERNCVSNIRDAGLAPALAARKLAWLVAKALSGQCTGVGLKDDSDSPPTPLGTEPC